MVDLYNRWLYRGSLTTPPCSIGIYWNVLQNVYPIKQKHLDQFKAQLNRASEYTDKTLSDLGNYRVIQETTPLHNLQTVSIGFKEADNATEADFWVGFGLMAGTIFAHFISTITLGAF